MGNCGWKTRGKKCGEPAVALRDLGPRYGNLRKQYVCKVHANYVDGTDRMQRVVEPDASEGDAI